MLLTILLSILGHGSKGKNWDLCDAQLTKKSLLLLLKAILRKKADIFSNAAWYPYDSLTHCAEFQSSIAWRIASLFKDLTVFRNYYLKTAICLIFEHQHLRKASSKYSLQLCNHPDPKHNYQNYSWTKLQSIWWIAFWGGFALFSPEEKVKRLGVK